MHRDFTLKLKSLDAGGSFQGIASTYNNVDLMGDTILPGAFAQSIKQQGSGVPILFAHDQSQPLGVGKLSDSSAGLLIDGKLVMEDPGAQRAYAHLKAGSIKGLSIGYQVPDGKSETQRDGTRLLREVRLHEVSLVACPADPGAQVVSVKALASALAEVKIKDLQADDRATLLAAMKRLLSAKNVLCECTCPECLAGDCADCSDADCEDENCAANVNNQAETLSALRSLAARASGIEVSPKGNRHEHRR